MDTQSVLPASRNRLSCLLLATCLLLGLPSAALQAQNSGAIDIGPIYGTGSVRARTINLVCQNPELLTTVRRAFSLHGGYEVKAEGRTDFVFTFVPEGTTGVQIIISSAGQELARQSFTGSSARQAALKAADYAVSRTLGTPGFFAGRLTFVSDQTGSMEVYVSDLLFEEARRLTSDRNNALTPDLAPDLSKVIYTSYFRSGFPEAFEIDLRTGQRRTFAAFRGLNSGASFSPNGSQVAIILSGSGNAELFLMSASGQVQRRLTRTQALEADPSWSPDGTRLVFAADDMGRPQIFTINADGSNRRRVPTNISGNCTEPHWNPRDPSLIAFTAASGNEFEVTVYSFTTQKSTILSRGAGDALHPVWLNDGRHILYTSRTGSRERLMILDSLTGRQVPLSPDGLRNCSMAAYVYPR